MNKGTNIRWPSVNIKQKSSSFLIMSTSKKGKQFCCSTSTENLINGTKLFKSYRKNCKFIYLGHKQRTSSTQRNYFT